MSPAAQNFSEPQTRESLDTFSLENLTSSDPTVLAETIARLNITCEKSGFFNLTNHGVSKTLLRRVTTAARNFFALPSEIKERYGHSVQTINPPTCRGYNSHEQLGGGGKDCKQMFDLGLEHPGDTRPYNGVNFLPPDDVAKDFTASLTELQDDVRLRLVPALTRAFGLALANDPTFFDEIMEDITFLQRVLHYPVGVGSCGKHTDSGLFTVLIQETSPHKSLRVFTEGKWVPVASSEDVFVINLGDLLEHISDKRYVSTAHAVVNDVNATRVSIPCFIYPSVDAVLYPMNGGKGINVGEFMLNNFYSVWEKKTGAGRAGELE